MRYGETGGGPEPGHPDEDAMATRRPGPRVTRRGFLATSLGAALVACSDAPLVAADAEVDGSDGEPDGEAPDVAEVAADTAPDVLPDIAETTPDPDTETVAVEVSEVTPDTNEVEEPPRYDPGALPEAGLSTFPIGVWSSDPTSDDRASLAITLAVRYLGDGPLELVVFRVDGFSTANLPIGPIVHRTAVPLDPGDAGFIRFDLRSAEVAFRPHTDHAFVFVSTEHRSPVGRFKTPPAVDATPVITLGVTSCASYTFRPFQVLERASESELDAFILLGDTTYADDARSLDDYRGNWQRNLQQPGYTKLRPRIPTIATWDDHEVDNNWNPETFDGARLVSATRCFFEHTTPRSASPQIWRSLRFGHTVEVFVLDCRGERRPSTRTSNDPLYLSNAQRDWLVAGLNDSPCMFKLVANTVSIAKWPPLYLGGDDRWQGYAKQREHVLSQTADTTGVIWVAGDFHFGSVHRIDPPDGPFHEMTEVLVGPVAHLNPALSIVELTGDKRQFEWLSGERNYGRFIFDPAANKLTIEHVAPGGTVLRRTELMA